MDTNLPTDPIVSVNNNPVNPEVQNLKTEKPRPQMPASPHAKQDVAGREHSDGGQAKRKIHIPKITILIGFFIILLILMQGGLYLAKKSDSTYPSPTPIVAANPSPNPMANWNKFMNDGWQYSFSYPSEWTNLTLEPTVGSEESGNLIASADLEKIDYSNVEKGAYIYGPYTAGVVGGTWENVFKNYTTKPIEIVEDELTLDGQEAKIGIIKNTNSTDMVIFYKYPTPIKFDGQAKPIEWSFISLVSSVNEFEKNKEIFEQILSTFKFSNPNSMIVNPDGSSSSPANPGQTEPAAPVMVACTMEAKLCPDGVTSVGRSGPKCEFEKCPGE